MTIDRAVEGEGYSAPAKWIHWIMAVCILVTIPVGIAMVRLESGPLQNQLFDLHRSLGIVILVLAVIRVIVRWSLGAPAPYPGLTPFQRVASNVAHKLLYVLIFVMPLLGWAGTSAFGAPIHVFGLFELPPLLAKDEALSKVLLGLHTYTAFFMVAVLGAHIGGALMHALILRDGVIWRMLPSWR